MLRGSSESRRRSKLRRLYREYAHEPLLARVRQEAGGVLVPGIGPMTTGLMFVGEAPGALEAKLRTPFVGASGKLLNEMLRSVGLRRDDVFVTNVVKYRPQNNRDPEPAEREVGRGYLWREHALLGYPLLVTLGRHAALALGAEYTGIGEWRYVGSSFAPMLVLRHPAYGLYQRSHQPLMFEQFQAVLHPPRPHHAPV